MTPSAFLQAFLAHSHSKEMRLIVARGTAPLPPDEMLELLVSLAGDEDGDVSAQAAATLENWPVEDTLPQVQSRDCPEPVLDYFARASSKPEILEAVILNMRTSGEAIEALASRAPSSLLETILLNRVRLLEHPGILQSVKLNPDATPQVQRLVQEVEQEFFAGKKQEYSVEVEDSAAPAESVDLGSLEAELPLGDLSLEGLPLDPEERQAALTQRLAKMTIRQKIRHAMLGTREMRSILVRDTNKEVARAVLQSPKLTESEVEGFSAMRNVADEVLRDIGNSRNWSRSYNVIHNLVRNPKTPPMISQRLMIRLQNRDLHMITRDRGISEVVRRTAQRTLSQRLTSKPTG
jgi:hypothetical protein